jgi:DNA polymerase I-like protein with 3'-5' exonuclease and polymerase domains
VAGLTNTLRFKHAEIVNLPKVGLPFADAIRGSLVCEDNEVLVGADMSALEDKLKQHFIYPLDPDYVETMRRDDYDAHTFFAAKAGACTVEQSRKYALNDKAGTLDADDKALKKIRDPYKNGNYACQYNAYPPRLAITCGISLKEAKKLFEDYWELNWSIKKVAEELTVKEIDGEKWLYNPINCFWYSLRKENDRFSTLIQGTASYVFDKWLGLTLQESNRISDLIGQFHDEFILRIKKENIEETKKIIKTAIKELNKELKLNIELGVGIQVGARYSDIH